MLNNAHEFEYGGRQSLAKTARGPPPREARDARCDARRRDERSKTWPHLPSGTMINFENAPATARLSPI